MPDKNRTEHGPSKHYEIKRRTIYRGVQEAWNFINHELEKLKEKGADNLTNIIQDIISLASEHKV